MNEPREALKINLKFRPKTYWPTPGSRPAWKRRRPISSAGITGFNVTSPYAGSSGQPFPPRRRGEVQLCLIRMNSTLLDQEALWASPKAGGGIRVRWVRDYDCDNSFEVGVFQKPLSHEEMMVVTRASLSRILMEYCENDPSPRDAVRFVSIVSDFYPELGLHHGRMMLEWVKENAIPAPH